MVTLRIIDGPGAGCAVEVTESGLSIGRDPSCGLQLSDVKASRRHAVLEVVDGAWQVTDQGSANGVWIGKRRHPTISLSDGQEFRIGTTILRFETSNDEGSDDWGDTIVGLDGSRALVEGRGNGGSAGGEWEGNDYLVLLHQVIHRSQRVRSREELFDILVDVAAEALDGDRCAVFLPKGAGWLLWPPHERRLRARFGTTPFARTLLAAARERSEALLCTARGDINPSQSMAQAGVRSAMVAPLRIGSEIHGLIYVDRLESSAVFSRNDLEFLEAVANQLAVRLHNMTEIDRLEAEVERLSQQRPKATLTLIGSDGVVAPIRAFIDTAAAVDSPLLLIGESGTGKHTVAKAIHLASARHEAPLQVLACAAYDESAHELNLFGRAASGVDEARPGILELADGGSLLLDEAGVLSPILQRRVATMIEHGQVQRLGDTITRSVSVRVMLTVSADPSTLGPELLNQVSHLSLQLPPLRARPDDIELLIEHSISESAERLDQPCRRLSAEARSLLLGHPWPGNIRQLRTVIEHAMVVAQGKTIGIEDLPESFRDEPPVSPEDAPHNLPLVPLAEMERLHILRMLDHCGGNKKAAAELLGIDRSTLYAKLRQYGVHN